MNGEAPEGPYRERIAEAARPELSGDEPLLGATRLAMPRNTTKVDENGKERSGLLGLSWVQHYIALVRTPPKPITGFPAHWDTVIGVTRHRLAIWRPRRGTHQPGEFLGSVQLDALEYVELATVTVRTGRTLAVKFALRDGPRIMLDVVAGFRADTEQFVEEVTHQLEVRRFLQ